MNDIERVKREIQILKRIKHSNIIQLFEIIESKEAIYLIMEYAAGGELFNYIVEKNRLPEHEAAKFFY
jgi:5'-AMP-activated protein kinase catalytic alpha subunit